MIMVCTMHLVVDRSVKLSSSLLFFPSLVSVSFLLEAAFVEIEVDLDVYSVQFQVCTGNTDSTQWYNKPRLRGRSNRALEHQACDKHSPGNAKCLHTTVIQVETIPSSFTNA